MTLFIVNIIKKHKFCIVKQLSCFNMPTLNVLSDLIFEIKTLQRSCNLLTNLIYDYSDAIITLIV